MKVQEVLVMAVRDQVVIIDNLIKDNSLRRIHGSKEEEIKDPLAGLVEDKCNLMGRELVEAIFRICNVSDVKDLGIYSHIVGLRIEDLMMGQVLQVIRIFRIPVIKVQVVIVLCLWFRMGMEFVVLLFGF